jgi:hypothetical protein
LPYALVASHKWCQLATTDFIPACNAAWVDRKTIKVAAQFYYVCDV